MYETLEHWKQYKQKKHQQCPAEKPGAMVLDEMIEAEEQAKELFNECGFQYKEKAKQEMDKFLNKITTKNGTTNY